MLWSAVNLSCRQFVDNWNGGADKNSDGKTGLRRKNVYKEKEAIYEKPYRNTVKPFELEGFTLVQKQELRYAITLTSHEEIQNLFMMTPYYYKTGAADQQKLALREWLTTPVEFAVLGYQRVDWCIIEKR